MANDVIFKMRNIYFVYPPQPSAPQNLQSEQRQIELLLYIKYGLNNIWSQQKSSTKQPSKSGTTSNRCNCRQNTTCPLNGECCSSYLVYKALITTEENAIPEKHYYGLCETTFKTRYNNHTYTFRDKKKQNCTEPSKLHWILTSAGKKPKISWTSQKHANGYQSGTSKCQLCLAEKALILQANPSTTINRRAELVSKCRRTSKNKFKLKNFKPD